MVTEIKNCRMCRAEFTTSKALVRCSDCRARHRATPNRKCACGVQATKGYKTCKGCRVKAISTNHAEQLRKATQKPVLKLIDILTDFAEGQINIEQYKKFLASLKQQLQR